LIRLATAQRTRMRMSEVELCGESDVSRAALRALVAGRLVVSESLDRVEYALAHEVLLEHWKRLVEWLEADSALEQLKQRLSLAAREWSDAGRAVEALWPTRKLSEYDAAGAPPEGRTALEHEFLDATRRSLRRASARRVALWAALPSLLLTGYAAFSVKSALERDAAVEARRARAATLTAEARARREEERALSARAFSLFDSHQPAEAELVWDEVLAAQTKARRAFALASQELEAAFLLDAHHVELRHDLGEVLFERAELAERTREPAQQDEVLGRLRLIDEARWASWSAPATVVLDAMPAAEVHEIGRAHV
jgi:hypothetical protein